MRRTRYGKCFPAHYALRGLIPLGVLVTAVAVAGQAPDTKRDESVVPTPPTKPAPTSVVPPPAPDRTRLEITVLRIGAEPFCWGTNRQQVRTFITNTADALEINAQAVVSGQEDAGTQIEWEVTPPAGFQLPGNAIPTGESLSIKLTRAGGNPTGMGEPLTVGIKAR
jgi:hypothetical protein